MDVRPEFSTSQPILVPLPSPTGSPELPKPSRLRKIVKVCLTVFLVLLIILTPVIIYLDHRDMPSVDQSGLTLDNPQVPDSENMIFDLEKLKLPAEYDDPANVDVVYGRLNSTLEASILDTATASKILQGNEGLVSSFLQASQKPYFQDPTTTKLPIDNANIVQLGALRLAARLVCLDARVKGQTPAGLTQAHDELEAVLKVGNRMGNEQGTTLAYSVAQAILKLGYQTVNILGIKDPSFLQYADTAHGAYLTLVVKYYAGIDNINDIKKIASAFSPESITGNPKIDYLLGHYKYNPLNGFYYEPNRTRQTIINTTLSAIHYIVTDCSSKTTFSPPDFPFPTDTWRAYLSENLIGKFILSSISMVTTSQRTKRCEVETLAKQ